MKLIMWLIPILSPLLLVGQSDTEQDAINLIMRIDDMGSSHAANMACIEAFQNGIARSVEVMVPGPWFEEAVHLLNLHPNLDVGVHLTLTSEWSNIKWRPLTYSPSLTDENGYFYPMIWKNDRFPAGSSLKEAKWKLQEVEKEWRAQIEMAIQRIPQVSHLTAHMGCAKLDPKTDQLFRQLALEYNLDIFPEDLQVQSAPRWSGNQFNAKEKRQRFIDMLKQLTPGTWLTVEHPAYDVTELATVGHVGYENVAKDRQGVTEVLTHPKVKQVIQKRGIQLFSYRDIIRK